MVLLGLTGGIDSVFEASNFINDSGIGHDSAAVLMRDGRVIAAIEEERVNRIKHTNKMCVSAIRFCLQTGNLSLSDVDAICFYSSEDVLNDSFKKARWTAPELDEFPDVRHYYQHLFEKEFDCKLELQAFRFIPHHLAHVATTYYMSGFDKSLVLTIDAEGDHISMMVVDAQQNKFKTLRTKSIHDSLGMFYLKVIGFLGYGAFDEYKVMGLAPYGNPEIYREQFRCFYSLMPDGDFSIHTDRIASLYEQSAPRRKNEPFTQDHMDIAAALQESLEDIVFHVLQYFKKVTGNTRLAICGGVGQNSSLNGKILISGLFEDVFAPSFAGDSGCAYGAAAYTAYKEQENIPLTRIDHAYWGTPVIGAEAKKVLPAWSSFLTITKMRNTAEEIAELIAQGSVIGWLQGRSEFGPRALGNRSILADPRIASHKDTINAMIKKREGYRPFAPSIIEEEVRNYFEVPGKHEKFPFMSFVLNVKKEWRELLPAITHVDGTARLQTVSRESNERFWELINAFGKKTGIPILLNTSFNNNAEPIVDTINDAVVCYLTSKLDYLVVDDYLMHKKNVDDTLFFKLCVELPKAASLIREVHHTRDENRNSSHYISWNFEPTRKRDISKEWYNILLRSNGKTCLEDIMLELNLTKDQEISVMKELHNLWSDRLITLLPNFNNDDDSIALSAGDLKESVVTHY